MTDNLDIITKTLMSQKKAMRKKIDIGYNYQIKRPYKYYNTRRHTRKWTHEEVLNFINNTDINKLPRDNGTMVYYIFVTYGASRQVIYRENQFCNFKKTAYKYKLYVLGNYRDKEYYTKIYSRYDY